MSATLITVALAAALIGALGGVAGSFLVLRRQSLLGDVVAHAALPGIVAGFLLAGGRSFPVLLLGALVAGVLAALAVDLLRRGAGVRPDAALGVVLSLFFALGLVLMGHAQGQPGSAGLSVFLFGQAASVLRADLLPMAAVAAVVLGVVAVGWKDWLLLSFDPLAARVQGRPVAMLEAGLAAIVAVAIVMGLSMAGVVLMVAMLVAPAVAARQWVSRLAPMVILAAALGAGSGMAGAVISAQASGLATGPVMVLVASLVAALSLSLAPGRGFLARALDRRRARHALAGRQVLAALHGLARAHDDPDWPGDAGMLDAVLGAPSGPVLERLRREGLVHEVPHAPEPTPRYALTARGRHAAEAAANPSGGG